MSLRFTTTRLLAPRLQAQARPLSTQTTQAVSKLQSVLEEYRQAHYTQCLPSRFKKDIVRAATDGTDQVVHQSIERVLHNIGASQRLSTQEVQLILEEVGTNGGIPASEFAKLL